MSLKRRLEKSWRWFKENWILILGIVVLIIVILYLYVIDEKYTEIALKIITTILGIIGLYFLIVRTKKADTQIEESQNANFLNSLHQGINMLYDKEYNRQIGGIEYLHSLAKNNKDNSKKAEAVVKVFCAFLRELKEDTGNDKKEKVKKRNEEIRQIKQKILTKIGDKENTMYHNIKKELSGAHLKNYPFDLRKSVLPNTDLQDVILININLREANLKGVVIQNSEEDNIRTSLNNVNLRKANLQGAIFESEVLCPNSAIFYCADLREAKFLGSHRPDITTLAGADLRDAKIGLGQGSDLSYAFVNYESLWVTWNWYNDYRTSGHRICHKASSSPDKYEYEKTHPIVVRKDDKEKPFKWNYEEKIKEEWIGKEDLIKRLEERKNNLKKHIRDTFYLPDRSRTGEKTIEGHIDCYVPFQEVSKWEEVQDELRSRLEKYVIDHVIERLQDRRYFPD